MLREEVEQYTELTGEDGWHVPIMKVGAYLDGYNKGLEILDKIRAEMMKLQTYKMYEGENTVYVERDDVLAIIDKYTAESEE